jgi:heat shock protein HspQ
MATPPRKRPSPAAPVPPPAEDRTVSLAARSKVVAKAKAKAAKPAPVEPDEPQQPATKLVASKAIAAARAKAAKASKAVAGAPAAGMRQAKFSVGAVVKHRVYPFRGVVFDIDPVFNNTEDWWNAIPEEIRPRKDQPFYHLLAENAETTYVAYVSEQNLLADKTGQPVRHPQVKEMFASDGNGQYKARFLQSH